MAKINVATYGKNKLTLRQVLYGIAALFVLSVGLTLAYYLAIVNILIVRQTAEPWIVLLIDAFLYLIIGRVVVGPLAKYISSRIGT